MNYLLFFRYSTLSDVWAIGITMYEIITLHNPFEEMKTIEEIKSLLSSGKYPVLEDKNRLYDIEMIEIINLMLKVFFFSYMFIFFLFHLL
jgi:serine/threonine protein kinase